MNPITRKEVFLDAICDGEPCGLEPASREELVLKKLAESMVGGGGSGGGGDCDWNAMKNKPFDAERGSWIDGEPEIFNINTDANGYAEIEQHILGERDRYYRIVVDGISYSGMCVDVTGNHDKIPVDYHNEPVSQSRVVEFVDDDGQPFCVIFSGLGAGYSPFTEFHNFPANSEIAVEFGLEAEEITAIDSKYLPASVMTTEKAIESFMMIGGDGNTYGVYIDSDGKLVAEQW